MKKITTLLLLALLPLIVKAYDAKIDGVYYNLNTETQNAYVTGLSSLSTYNKNAYKGNVTIPETIIYNGVTYSVTMIDQHAFYNCMGLKSVTIPNSVTVIGWSAFMYTNLTSINIPNSVTRIGMNAFKFCKALTSVTIPNSVTEIGTWAFCGCSNLASITIGSRVKSIDEKAFIKCSSLKNVYCYANDIPTTGSDVFANSPIKNATLYVPTELIENYKITEPWSEFGSIVSLPSVVVEGIAINETNFPDENFRNWILSQSYGNDGILTEEEIASVTQISVTEENIQDLKGIEHFTALKNLICWGNELTYLDLSKNIELEELYCNDNKLTSLDLSKNTKLISLECYSNQLTSLNVSGCTVLEYLYCYSNQLTSLDVSKNTKLADLSCDDNRLTSLDVSKNTELTYLYCYSNQLISLDVSKNTELTTLYCYQNQIKDVEMDALVKSLPTISDGEMMVIYYEDEGNVMTTTQVATAKAKGWTPYYSKGELDEYDDVIWQEYAGRNDDVLRGDVNDDGEVNMNDATFVTNIILGIEDATEAADVNLDGIVSMPDVMYIINYIKNGRYPDDGKETMLNTPLTLEAITAGTITFRNAATGIVTYKIDDGVAQIIDAGTSKEIPVSAGQKVAFYGDNETYYNGSQPNGNRHSKISSTADFYVYGNIMSLINSTDFVGATVLTGERTFSELFGGDVKLRNHPSKQLLLPATTLAEDCYAEMFQGCTSLTTAPALPAMSVTGAGYAGMFDGCTSLTKAPELPATTVGIEGYAEMFSHCTSLTTAPALPATTLADYCYSEMFEGCTALTAAPTLPAPTLVQGCYQHMFEGCSNLNSVKCLATNISASHSTNNWLKGVSTSGTFVKAASASWPSGEDGIPTGWTVQ